MKIKDVQIDQSGGATHKYMKTKGGQNRRAAGTHWAAGKRKDRTGTLSAEPGLYITASVTICQVRN